MLADLEDLETDRVVPHRQLADLPADLPKPPADLQDSPNSCCRPEHVAPCINKHVSCLATKYQTKGTLDQFQAVEELPQ